MIASLRMRLTLFSELFGRPLPEMSVASAQMMASFVKLLLDQAQQQAQLRESAEAAYSFLSSSLGWTCCCCWAAGRSGNIDVSCSSAKRSQVRAI